MGDRGQTATNAPPTATAPHYSRWEIGGKPQPDGEADGADTIIADGRSGANRNHAVAGALDLVIIADGRSGANRNKQSPASSAIIL